MALNIRRLAKERGLSISALARQSGVSRQNINNLLYDKCLMNPAHCYNVAHTLGITLDELLQPAENFEKMC